MKPKMFLASPLFNDKQHQILDRVEDLLKSNGFDFYSARHHSGSHIMTPEQRKDFHAWDAIFDSNVDGLDECQVMICVLEYAMPEDTGLYLCTDPTVDEDWFEASSARPIELPDAGTVFEVGYHHAQGKLIFGFHSQKKEHGHLNLMLSHSCDGIVFGWDNLGSLLRGEISEGQVERIQSSCSGDLNMYRMAIQRSSAPETLLRRGDRMRSGENGHIRRSCRLWSNALWFNWDAVENWDREVE